MGDILSRRALPARRLARLGAAPQFHHGLLSRRSTLVVLRDAGGDPSGGAAGDAIAARSGHRAGLRGATLVSTVDRGFSRSSRLDRPEVVIMSQVFPGQDGSPREAGQRDAVTSEADPLFHARGSEAQPR